MPALRAHLQKCAPEERVPAPSAGSIMAECRERVLSGGRPALAVSMVGASGAGVSAAEAFTVEAEGGDSPDEVMKL